jgi:hypothetical protein
MLGIIIEKLSKPSIKPAEPTSEANKQYLIVIDELESEPAYDWMHLIKMFLENPPPSDDNAKVERIACKSKLYHLIDEILFWRCLDGMMMKCISR